MSISVLTLGMLYGGYKWLQSVGNTENAKKIAEENRTEYLDARERYERIVHNADDSARRLGNVRVQAWQNDMKRFSASYKRFAGVKISGENFGKNDFGLQVSNPISLTTIDKLSTSAEELVLNGAASVAGGALAIYGVYGLVSNFGVAATTGTAIGTLAGAAAHNATMAWLGGGALSIGGGGMAAGSSALLGIGGGAAAAVSGIIAESTSRRKLEEVLIEQSECRRQIEEMQQVGKRLDRLKALSDSFYSFQKEFSTMFNKMLTELDRVYDSALSRRSKLEKILENHPHKVSINKLTLKELVLLKLVGATAQVNYSLLSIPIANENFDSDQDAKKLIYDAKQASGMISSVYYDIQHLSDDEFEEKYGEDSKAVENIKFAIPTKVNLKKSQKSAREKSDRTFASLIVGFFSSIFCFTISIVAWAVIISLAYIGYFYLEAGWKYYLGVVAIILIAWPFATKRGKKRRTFFSRVLRLVIGVATFAAWIYYWDSNILLVEIPSFFNDYYLFASFDGFHFFRNLSLFEFNLF